MAGAIYHFFSKISMKEVLQRFPTKAVIAVESKTPVEKALKALSDNRILSVPVVDAASGEITSLVDVLDIVCWVASKIPQHSAGSEPELRQALQEVARGLATSPISLASESSGRDPFAPVLHNVAASTVIRIFSSGIRRIPILGENDEMISTISQSDVIRFLSEHLDTMQLRPAAQMDIGSLGLGKHACLSAKLSDSVLECLWCLSTNKVSAVALIDAEGRLAGNLSASDFRGITTANIDSLLLPAGEYLQLHNPKSLAPVSVNLTTTFKQLVGEITTRRIHRVWVVDGEGRPQSVVSLTDLMHAFTTGILAHAHGE
jgi:CBS domain-containing protein